MAVDAIFPPIWAAAPPEVHSALLTAGATAAGIAFAATSWTQLSVEYFSALAELEGIIAVIQANYQGPAAEQFVAAHQPMLAWLFDVAAKSTIAAGSHAEIAAAYEGAVVTMPNLGELFENHFVHGVLIGTNFFGVNTMPIGLNEADYQRMWELAADVMAGWDVASTTAVDVVPPTPMAPPILMPGVGEAGLAAASAASSLTLAQAQVGGVAMTGADMMSTKLLVGKASTSPLSFTDRVPLNQGQNGPNTAENGVQQPQNMAGSLLQQMGSIGPSAAQSAAQGPMQLLTSAPQQLASAPQQLGSMLTQFAGSSGGSTPQSTMPVGFAGTGALRGFNPAGMTSLAGGGLGTGPSRPLMPSTWGATPTSALAESARGISPVTAGLTGGSAASGSGAGGGMMGQGAHGQQSRSQRVARYADDTADDAGSDEGAYTMTR